MKPLLILFIVFISKCIYIQQLIEFKTTLELELVYNAAFLYRLFIVLFAKQKIAYKLESNFGRLFRRFIENNRFVIKPFIMLQG